MRARSSATTSTTTMVPRSPSRARSCASPLRYSRRYCARASRPRWIFWICVAAAAWAGSMGGGGVLRRRHEHGKGRVAGQEVPLRSLPCP